MDTLGSTVESKNPANIVFLVSGESRYGAIICSASVSSLTLRDASGTKAEAGLPQFFS